jgi:uncharacterized membrane protein
MSELMVVAYADRNRADDVMKAISQRGDGWLDRNDTVPVIRDKKGRLRIPDQPQTRALAWGALWRKLLEAGATAEETAGGLGKRRSTTAGIPRTFVQTARELVGRANSALIILIRSGTPSLRLPPDIEAILCRSGDNILRAPLSSTQDALLYGVLDVFGPFESGKA